MICTNCWNWKQKLACLLLKVYKLDWDAIIIYFTGVVITTILVFLFWTSLGDNAKEGCFLILKSMFYLAGLICGVLLLVFLFAVLLKKLGDLWKRYIIRPAVNWAKRNCRED
jgi:hypothetical protein